MVEEESRQLSIRVIAMCFSTSDQTNIRIVSYSTSFISVLIDITIMALIKSVKRIGTAGTSKIVPVTKEIKALKLDVKDSVIVSLAVPGSEEEYALEIASAFVNPDVYYVNNRIMCSKDRYPDGRYIENRLSSRTSDDCEQAFRRLSVMQDFIDVMREFTKNKVAGPYAYYNDELHTFIARFDPDKIAVEDEAATKIKILIAQMDILRACLESDVFSDSGLDSVKHLQGCFDRALSDAAALLDCPPDERDKCREHLNEVWSEEISNIIYCDLFFIGCIIQYHANDLLDRARFPLFVVTPAPTYRMALEKLQELAVDTIGDGMQADIHIFGPFEDESECEDVTSYLKVRWKIEAGISTEQTVTAWVKNALNEYNNSTGE